MDVQVRELYSSPNGDRWDLARDPASGQVLVRHQANPASGGESTDIAIAAFLSRGPHGPEHQEVQRLIGTLVHDREKP